MLPSDLIGRVVAERLGHLLEPPSAGRLLFGVMGLSADLACAIAREVAALQLGGVRVDASVHPDLAGESSIGEALGEARISDETATHHRNRPYADDVALTLFSVPAGHVASVEASMQHVERINDAWLLEDLGPWAKHGLPSGDDDMRRQLEQLLRGLVRSEAAFDARRVAEFTVRLARHMADDGLALARAARRALPALRLPRDAGDPRAKLDGASEAEHFFRRVFDEARPALHLRGKDGEPLDRADLKRRLKSLSDNGEVSPDSCAVLAALLGDPGVGDDGWAATQAAAAELPWEEVERLFAEDRRRARLTFGEETLRIFDARHPVALSPDERGLLGDLRSESARPSEAFDQFFAAHRDRLRSDPKLYRRWERLVFRKPIEVDDLAEGLLRLAERARPDGDDPGTCLYVRLHEAHSLAFWTEDKNTKLCRVLRDRWRGLRELLEPDVVLDFGHCWSEVDWEKGVDANGKGDEVTSTSKDAVVFRFEGYVVPRSSLTPGGPSAEALKAASRAQLIWKPQADAIASAFPIDLQVLASEPAGVPLLRARMAPNRYDRHGAVQAVDLANAATVIDVSGNSNGRLCDPTRAENRIEDRWTASLAQISAAGILTAEQAEAVHAAFNAFREAYGRAIRAMATGRGLADDLLLRQAELYGELLRTLAREARAEICVRDLWQPLLGIGCALVETNRPSLLLTPCHPLRLGEIAAKARQLAQAMRRVLRSPAAITDEVGAYVDATVASTGKSYYVDVGIAPMSPPVLLVETRRLADVSLLEPPTSGSSDALADEPAEETVRAFDNVASEYLDLRPHEKASFSAVLLDAESEDLPVLMANSMARRIEAEPSLRCDLVLTHENVASLRRVYERQNRRIGHEVDSSLTSEAARNFLSRLRVAIVNPEMLDTTGGKNHDIVLLQDVISRRAEVRWARARTAVGADLGTHVPTAQSKRKPFQRGDTTSGTYLTAPGHPDAAQAYVDALHDVLEGRASEPGEPWLPMQEVEFRSGKVSDVLAKAHRLGNWVMTFDRLADRRLVSSDDRRIIRYFSDPRSDHNVIVSTEISETALGERLMGDLAVALPSAPDQELQSIVRAIHSASSSLSGAIVMRGAQRRNHAQELLGLVLAKHQLELLLGTSASEHRSAWFFLDDFSSWLGLEGSRADLLAVDFAATEDGSRVRLVVGEAKFVSQDGLGEQRQRSLEQLGASFSTFDKRLVSPGGTVDPATWRGRIADLVLEHVDPFDQVGGVPFGEWIAALRSGSMPIEISGHSMVFVHDLTTEPPERLHVPDADEPRTRRRPLAQWMFGRTSIGRALRALVADETDALIWTPPDWPRAEEGGRADGGVLSPQPVPSTDAVIGAGAPPLVPAEPQAAADYGDPCSELAGTRTEETSKIPVPAGWHPAVHQAVAAMARKGQADQAQEWLEEQIKGLRLAIQKEGMDAPILASRLTPNSGLIELDGRSVTVSWLERKQTDLLTKYGIDIIRISPKPGRIAVGIRRPKRAILHLADAWLRRSLEKTAPQANMALLVGEKEDDGSLFYLPIAEAFGEQERAAPHSIISGTTGSGKGILATSLMLDACAFNSPADLDLRLIDPKKGVDYSWLRQMPHLRGDIIERKEDAVGAFRELVGEMERRYEAIKLANVNNVSQFNLKAGSGNRLARILVFFDEVANWMQDDDFKQQVEPLINEIATKSRAAGIHLFMIYQRADNQVMTMQLRTNLGNKLVLRLGDEGSSKIALNEKGAERLLGKGHVIAKLDSDDKTYGQVPYITEEQVQVLAAAIADVWRVPAPHSMAAD